jgi:hypothetical protein
MKHIKKVTAKDTAKRPADAKAREAMSKEGKKSRVTCPEIH